MTPALEASDLHFAYDDTPVLGGVDFALAPGELVALVGPNGAGKSTLLHLLLGVFEPSKGEVRVGERPLGELSRADIARRIAFVPQETRADFAFSVREIVAMGRTPHLGRFRPERREDVAAVERALDATDVRSFAHRAISELSGGERKRVHIARALAQETSVLLFDEPTASLDVEHQLEILALVRRLVRDGKTAAIALHDLSLAARFADRVVVLAAGRIRASGKPEDVFTDGVLRNHFHIRARIERDPDGVVVVVPIEPAQR
jgi:iron complex transport system ATP-binding protein